VVVSGLARGIDGAAHAAALEAGGASVAFLPCGIERVYPPSHRRLAEALAANGALVSEFPPDTPPRAPYFPLRNRLISALSEAVVVVEGRIASGTLTTARHAANQGVDVLAVPGPIHSPTSAGPHQLIRDGAGLVTSGDDLLACFGIEPKRASGDATGSPTLSQLATRALTLLHNGPLTRDELSARLRAPESDLAPALLELELAERAKEDRDGTWCAT
jgi:DNA processing protein